MMHRIRKEKEDEDEIVRDEPLEEVDSRLHNKLVTKIEEAVKPGMSLLGVGTALVYPALLAAISDLAHPKWRATSLGVYRFWRDLGFVFGAIGIGFVADLSNINIAIQLVAWIAIASGIFVLVGMRETKSVVSI